MADASTHYDTDDCLDGPEGCGGQVFPRAALSGSGEHYTRCDHHWEDYYERTAPKMDAIRSRYPEMAPSGLRPPRGR